MTLDVWQEYRRWSREVVLMTRKEDQVCNVLKTDANNEAYGDEITAGVAVRPVAPYISDICNVTCLEIEADVVRLAQERFPELMVQQGDIRKLPFPDESFDVVLDLSTLDHVQEYQAALGQYARVLRHDGLALIVTWVDTDWRYEPCQVWFPEKEFMREIGKTFTLLNVERFTHLNGKETKGALIKVMCRRK